MKRFTYILLSAFIFVIIVACGNGEVSESSKLENMPEVLNVYTSQIEEVYKPIIKEFEERTGIWVKVQTGGSAELLQEIDDESADPVCDVMFGGAAELHEIYKDCFEEYTPKDFDKVHDFLKDSPSISIPFSLNPLVIVYNTKLVPQNQTPDKWEDLFDDKWSGKIAFADPEVSGASFISLSLISQLYDNDGFEAVTDFSGILNGTVLDRSEMIMDSLIEGRYNIGITTEGEAYKASINRKEVSYAYPAEGTCFIVDSMSVIKNSPNRENAQMFVDFLVNKDIQKLLPGQMYRRSVLTELDAPEGMMETGLIKEDAYSDSWTVSNYGKIMDSWHRGM